MTTNNIHTLLNKFYKGETSLDEEKKLAAFFEQNSPCKTFEADKKLFLALHANANAEKIPPGMSRRIETLIDSFGEEDEKPARKIKNIHYIYWAMGVAASLALVLGITQFSRNQKPERAFLADTYKNPDEAYRATLNALQLFSDNFSRGTESIEKANSHLEKSRKIVNQSIN